MRVLVSDRVGSVKREIARLLVSAMQSEPGEVWLVTPWLKDVEFDLTELGNLRPLLGANRGTVTLLNLLELLAEEHLVHVVTKPPHELVDLNRLGELHALLAERAALEDPDRQIEDYTLHDRHLALIQARVDGLRDEFLTHADTVLLAKRLAESPRGGVQVTFHEALHAKLLWGPSGAVFGSANFTNGGLVYNAELVAFVHDEPGLGQLREAAERLRAESVPSGRYDLGDPDHIPRKYRLRREEFDALATGRHLGEDERLRPLLGALADYYR